MASILIRNGTVWDGERFFSADVLTDGNIVAKIEKNIAADAEFVYDAAGQIVTAGLVDAHVHMYGVTGEEYSISADMSCLPFGVTAAADAGGGMEDREALVHMTVKNRVFVSVEIRDNKACFEKTERNLACYGEKAVGLKVYFDTKVSPVRDITPLREAIAYAEKCGLAVMVHSSNPPVPMSELLSVLRKGDVLTHAYHGGGYTVADDDYACIAEAKRRGIIIDVGMAGHVHTDFAVYKNAIACGALPDTISTDITRCSAYKRGGRYGMTMCMSIARTLGMQEDDVFRAVTSAPAKALGMEAQCGQLKVGRCADIAVLSYTNEGFSLTDARGNRVENTVGYRCKLTIADGEVVYRD